MLWRTQIDLALVGKNWDSRTKEGALRFPGFRKAGSRLLAPQHARFF
jgi:hypothetical protein